VRCRIFLFAFASTRRKPTPISFRPSSDHPRPRLYRLTNQRHEFNDAKIHNPNLKKCAFLSPTPRAARIVAELDALQAQVDALNGCKPNLNRTRRPPAAILDRAFKEKLTVFQGFRKIAEDHR